MKKALSLVLALALALSLAACGAAPQASSAASGSSGASSNMTDSQLAALGDIDVDENLFDVTITLPADLIGETTQEELDASVEAGNFHSCVLNDDGSVTYTMNKTQHQKMLDDFSASITATLDGMVGSDEYPNVTDIQVNDDYTLFTVTTTSAELSMVETISTLIFYADGQYYGVLSGKTPENIHVDFVNADTGEIISSADSKDMEAEG